MPPQNPSKPPGKGGQAAPTPRTTPGPRRAWKVNIRAMMLLGIATLAVAAAVAAVAIRQGWSGRPALLAQAKKLASQKTPDGDALALSFLKSYLTDNPRDLAALDLRTEILARAARSPEQFQDAIRAGEAALRAGAEPNDPVGQEIRRRLVNAYLVVGPYLLPGERKYNQAEERARELVEATGKPADMVLHARALQALASETGKKEYWQSAADELEKARGLQPKDVATTAQLAAVYSEMGRPEDGAARLKELIAAEPTAEAYLAAARYQASLSQKADASGKFAEARSRQAEADSLISGAVKVAPDDLGVRLEAASLAIGDKRPAAAAEHLDHVREKDRQDYRYLTLRGVVSMMENRTNDAVESWTKGLINTGGTEAELSWRLAFVLLQQGKIQEGAELAKQFRRLVGRPSDGADTPFEARYLEGLRLYKINQPADAIVELEKGRQKAQGPLLPYYHVLLGQALEATRDDAKAMAEYELATKADGRFASPRLARARLYAASGRLDDASAELKKGLETMGDDPTLLNALARLELDRQRRRPPKMREWKELDDLLARAEKVSPGSSRLAVLKANRKAADAKPEAALDMLRSATALNKTDPELWVARVEAEMGQGQLSQALLSIDQAMDPKAVGDNAALRILRARILTAQGRGTEAREGLVRDLENVPIDQRPRLYQALGELYLAQGADPRNMVAARQAFAEWARMLPDDPMPRLFVLEMAIGDDSTKEDTKTIEESLAVLRKSGGLYALIGDATFYLRERGPAGPDKEAAEKARRSRLDQADLAIAKIEKEYPQLRNGHLLRGELERLRRPPNLQAAARAYEKALVSEGGRGLALPRLVAVYNQIGGDAGAKALEGLRQQNPDVAQAISRAEAEAAAVGGDKDRAIKMAEEVVRADPENLNLRVWQARVLNTVGRPDDAEKALRELVALHPEAINPWMALANFQVGRNDRAGAVQTIESMIKQVPQKDLERPELTYAQAWRAVGERDRADAAYAAALKRWPDDPRVSRAAAEYYTASGRVADAEAVFDRAIKREDSPRWAVRGLALLLSARPGEPEAWRAAWDMVKDPAPGGDLPEDRLIRAVVLSRGPEASNREASSAELAKLVADLPADLPAAVLARGSLVQYLLKNEPAKAAEYAAVDANAPNPSPAALAIHTTALIASDQYDDAERQLARLSKMAPDDEATVTLRARLERARGKDEEAAAALESTAKEKINGPNGEAVGRVITQTLLGELNNPQAALRVADILYAKYPSTAGVKAAVLAQLGKREEALKLYLETIQSGDKNNVREAARNCLALITHDKFADDSVALAEKVIDAARQKDPASSELLAFAGYLRHFQKRYDDELKIYQDALAQRPDDITLLNNMAWTLCEGLGKYDEALAKIDEAIRKSSVVPAQLYDTRGCIYTRLKRYDDAVRDLEVAARDRANGSVLCHLARAYKLAGKEAEFARTRDRIKALKPAFTADMLEPSDRKDLASLIFGQK